MKSRIDALVRSILYELEHPRPADPQLVPLFQALGANNISSACQQRDVLASYAQDITLPTEAQQYAREQLEALPPF